MAFKNAFKILINKFGIVWMLLLFIFILVTVIASLSMAFMIPIYHIFIEGGITEQFSALFSSIMNGESINSWFEIIREIGVSVTDLFQANFKLRLNSALWLVLVVVFAYRFLLGLYELPLIAVLEGVMSSNAKIGFGGQIVSKLGLSCRFTLVKMLYTIIYDAFLAAVMFGMFSLMDVAVLAVFAPFLIMTVFILLTAFRYTVIAMWSPRVIIENKGIFSSFKFSVIKCFKNFLPVFSTFLVSWILIIAFNVFVGLFTLGAGLLISIPTSMLFLSILDMTLYYGKNGKRYYVDNNVVTPPYQPIEETLD